MKSSMCLLNKTSRRTFSSAVVPHSSKQDLTKKWLNRIQSKARDQWGQESYSKLSSLVDYYTKPPQDYKENIDWEYWSSNIRSSGVVEKIRNIYNDFKNYDYNVDQLAARSAVNSNKYDEYGLLLRYNHDLWMTQYMENLTALHGALELGDIRYIHEQELFQYSPGIREKAAGWRETGFVVRSKVCLIVRSSLL